MSDSAKPTNLDPDAALAIIFGKGAEAAPPQEATPDGDAPTPPADDRQQPPAHGSAEGTPPASSDAERFRAALRRDNVPDSVISSLADDDLAAWGAKAEARQAETDRLLSKRRPPEESERDAPEDEKDGQPQDRDRSRGTREKLENASVEAAKAARLEGELAVADEFMRERYGDKAPTAKAVRERVAQLGRERPGAFPSVRAMVEEAYRLMSGPLESRTTPSGGAQLTPPRRVERVESQPEDPEDVALRAIFSGKSVVEGKRLVDAARSRAATR